MRAAITKTVLASTVLAVALTACQTKPEASDCTVAAGDIETIMNDFKASFAGVAKTVAGGGTVDDSETPTLSADFAAPVFIRQKTDASDGALRYGWTVSIADGCQLDARLGTDTQNPSGKTYSVKALRFNGSVNSDGTLAYEPMAVVLNK